VVWVAGVCVSACPADVPRICTPLTVEALEFSASVLLLRHFFERRMGVTRALGMGLGLGGRGENGEQDSRMG
jgi:hypothetical protein